MSLIYDVKVRCSDSGFPFQIGIHSCEKGSNILIDFHKIFRRFKRLTILGAQYIVVDHTDLSGSELHTTGRQG